MWFLKVFVINVKQSARNQNILKKTLITTLNTIFQVNLIFKTTPRKRLDSKHNRSLENLISVKLKLWVKYKKVLNIGVTGVKFLPVCWYEHANFFPGIHQKNSIQITNFVIFMTTFSINQYNFLVLGFKRLA